MSWLDGWVCGVGTVSWVERLGEFSLLGGAGCSLLDGWVGELPAGLGSDYSWVLIA